ncbi:MAG: hypothetical protein AAGD01_07505 [Acidobacteriota bacterium]
MFRKVREGKPLSFFSSLALCLALSWACAAASPLDGDEGSGEGAALVAKARQSLTAYAQNPSDFASAREKADAAPRGGERWVMLSLLREGRSPVIARGVGSSLEQALEQAVLRLAPLAAIPELSEGRLKVDVLVERSAGVFDAKGRASLVEPGLYGLYLPGLDLALLPEELVAWGLMNWQRDLQSQALRWYLAMAERSRAPRFEDNPGRSGMPYEALRFDSWLESERGAEGGANGGAERLQRGRLPESSITPEALLEAAVAGGDYLVRHQFADGRFGYVYQAPRDRYQDSYNLLRHAGTSYSLFELYGVTGDQRYLEAGERGVTYLTTLLRGPKPEDEAAGASFLGLVSPREEGKLGGAALMTLAILEHHRQTGSERWLPVALDLARFMVFMQQEDGKFTSKYFWGEPDPVPFDSIYYPGEAILALSRLAKIDGSGPWLETAEDGAGWLMGVRDVGKSIDQLPHDHWLLMGLEELHLASGGGRTFFLHSRRIAESILRKQRQDPATAPFPDWVGSYYTPPRSTPTATRSEGLVAAYRTASRVQGEDPQPYLDAMLLAAGFQLRCQLGEINGAYLPNRQRAVGGFSASLGDWEVRIDYVQHNLSALLGLRSLLIGQLDGPPARNPQQAEP